MVVKHVSQNKKSGKVLSNWPVTKKPFDRVHIDFYDFERNKYLILVDNYSKWLEVVPMNSTIASATIDNFFKNCGNRFGFSTLNSFRKKCVPMFCISKQRKRTTQAYKDN